MNDHSFLFVYQPTNGHSDNYGGRPEEWPYRPLPGPPADPVPSEPALRVPRLPRDAGQCQGAGRLPRDPTGLDL